MKWIKKTYVQCIPLHFGVWLSFTVFLALLRNHCYSFHRTKGQVGGFQNPGVCRQAFPSFLPHPPPRSFTYTIFRAVFDSRSSFFGPKPHGNACYVGYSSNRARISARQNNDSLPSRTVDDALPRSSVHGRWKSSLREDSILRVWGTFLAAEQNPFSLPLRTPATQPKEWKNLTLATSALRFKIHAHQVGEGTIFAKP